jgi:ligand-binding sensor domain-containing protein
MSDYVHSAWRMSDGLPNDQLTAIRQAQDGYLWLTTFEGVARFDGARFVLFNLVHHAGLEGNVATTLLEDRDGVLWIGALDGLVRYQRGRMTAVTKRQGLSDSWITALCAANDGALWIGTRRGGLHQLRGGTVTALGTLKGVVGDDVRALAEDREGTLWVGSSAGLSRVRNDQAASVALGTQSPTPVVESLLVDQRGSLWIGTTVGLWFMPATRRASGSEAVPVPAFAGRRVLAFCEDDQTLWVGTDSGLARIAFGRVEFVAGTNLTAQQVTSLTMDREGSLWIATDGGGLNRLRKASVVVRSGGTTPSTRPMAIYRDAKGTMWTGSVCGGVTRWDAPLETTFKARQGLPNECVRAISAEPDGTIWIGTQGGLARLRNGRITAYTTKDGLSGLFVTAVAVDRTGTVWVGIEGSGIDRFSGGRFTNYSTANGLTSNDVRALAEGPDGTIWIATLGGGVNSWRGGVLSHVTRNEGLSSNYVLTMLIDKDGTVWVGTGGGGLDRIRNGAIAHFTSQHDLPSENIFQILDDGRGNLWMSCTRGIFWVSRSDFDEVTAGIRSRVRAGWLGQEEGVPPGGISAGGQPPGAIDSSGRLWFPTLEGVAIVDPRRVVQNRVAPQVHIERVLVDRHEMSLDQLSAIPAGRHAIQFDYTALSLVAPSQVLFKFQLKGLSDEWVEAGTRRSAYFTNLHRGSYRFQVQASNNDGVWNMDGAVLEFVVLPHFYETPLFYGVATALIVWVVWAGYRFRVRALRIRQKELSRDVEQAVAELKILSGLLPICASCKRIRDDSESWRPLESYIRDHSQARFSHGICPECMKKLYPEYADDPDGSR